MQVNELPAFLTELNRMAMLFCDEMSKERVQLYWELFRDKVSLEEWQYACRKAMLGVEFPKVPMPAILMDYVKEFRSLQLLEAQRAQRAEKPPLQIREEQFSLEQLRQLQMNIWPEERDRILKDPIPEYDKEQP